MIQTKYNLAYVWLITLTAALGGFLFGYDFVVIGGAKPFYEPYFDITTAAQQGWGTSSAIVGCIIGACLCIWLADRLGPRMLLILSGFLFTLSAIGTAVPKDFFTFNLFRIIGGVAMGAALNVVPMYISEIAPPDKRGMLVTVNQLMVNLGVLSAQAVNLFISRLDTQLDAVPTVEMIRASWSGQQGWRWMFGVEALPALAFFVLMFFVPDSVRRLIKVGRKTEAMRVLRKIGGEEYAQREFQAIDGAVSGRMAKGSKIQELLNPGVLKMIGLGIFLAFLQQWSGINVIIYYAADIFQAAGFSLQQMMVQIVAIGLVMLVAVIITIFTVERMGRRLILLGSTCSIAIIYGVIGASFYVGQTGMPVVVLVLLNVLLYSLSLAPLLWVVLSEIYPNRIRGAAMSIGALSHWLANFLLTFSFPLIKAEIGWANNFWLYGAITAIGFGVLYRYLPETKGKSLEELETILIKRKK